MPDEAVPTAEQEDARRVTRERKGLVREQTKLINRLKAMFACPGIRDFKPHLRTAPERFDGILTPEGDLIPANTLAEIRRAMDRLVLVRVQIKEVEDTRTEKIAQTNYTKKELSANICLWLAALMTL